MNAVGGQSLETLDGAVRPAVNSRGETARRTTGAQKTPDRTVALVGLHPDAGSVRVNSIEAWCHLDAKDGTLRDMRSAPVLLLVTLIGPSIGGVACDLACVQYQHRSADAMAVQGCHEQRSSNDGLAVTGGTAAPCHDAAQTVTTTAADPRPFKAAPVPVQLSSALAMDHPQLPIVARTTSFGPPGIALQTPLRI